MADDTNGNGDNGDNGHKHNGDNRRATERRGTKADRRHSTRNRAEQDAQQRITIALEQARVAATIGDWRRVRDTLRFAEDAVIAVILNRAFSSDETSTNEK